MRFSVKVAIIIIIVTLASRCSLVKPIATNPEPNMKTIHMVSHHYGYTPQEYKKHPDHDCREYR